MQNETEKLGAERFCQLQNSVIFVGYADDDGHFDRGQKVINLTCLSTSINETRGKGYQREYLFGNNTSLEIAYFKIPDDIGRYNYINASLAEID